MANLEFTSWAVPNSFDQDLPGSTTPEVETGTLNGWNPPGGEMLTMSVGPVVGLESIGTHRTVECDGQQGLLLGRPIVHNG